MAAIMDSSSDATSSGSDPGLWRVCKLRGAWRTVEWLPVTNIVSKATGHGVPVGLSRDGSWFALIQNELVSLPETRHLTCLLPWLEYSMQQALDQLQAGLRTAGFDAASAQPFPFPALVAHALNFCSPHWISCAIDWLDQGLPIDEMTATALGNISTNRRVSQKDCHRAFRFLKGWERAHSETDPA